MEGSDKMKLTLFSEKALTEKSEQYNDCGGAFSFEEGYKQCKEDLQAWLEGAAPLSKPHELGEFPIYKKCGKCQENVKYAIIGELLAEFLDKEGRK